MLSNVEEVAAESDLVLRGDGRWSYNEEHPHITSFHYTVGRYKGESDKLVDVGHVDGYRIVQDWSLQSDPTIWDEADALDGDVVTYVDALIRELRACEATFDVAPDLTMAQHVTIIRHVETKGRVDLAELIYQVTACLAMMDAPKIMLVDPWPMSDERKSSKGKLKGRAHITKLLKLGFVRMVGSRFLWGWNCELDESLMDGYSYDKLVEARTRGDLKNILSRPVSMDVYGDLPKGLIEQAGLPDPDDSMQE